MAAKFNITILVAPLDWGLGHATRCIPLINYLLQLQCKVIIAAEGAQEILLKAEFPELRFVHLQGYRINYTKNKLFFPLKIALQLPKIFLAIKNEKKWLDNFIKSNTIDAIISDNRYGLYHPKISSIFVTHQLVIKAPFVFAEKIMQLINYNLIEKFSACWVPDFEGDVNLAGVLSHPLKLPKLPVRYMGGVSRFQKQDNFHPLYDLLIILSGPEPQRTLLEKKILEQLKQFSAKVLFIRGLPGNKEITYCRNNIKIINHLNATELETAFGNSKIVICRSGYTTIMDICKLQKKAILIPTPGQTEQEYLAGYLYRQGWILVAKQAEFSINELLKKSENLEYKFPMLEMEGYKDVIKDFVNDVNGKIGF